MHQKQLYLSNSISNLNLSVRGKNCFKGAGIVCISELLMYSESEVLCIPNFDRETLDELKRELKKHGFQLRRELKKHGFHFRTDEPTGYVKLSRNQYTKLLLKVDELLLPIRPSRVLKNMDIKYVGDLVQLNEAALMKQRNLGRKSLSKIKEKLNYLNLNLGLKIESWPPINLHETIKGFRKELTYYRKNKALSVIKIINSDIQYLEDELEVYFSQFASNNRDWEIIRKLFGFDGNGNKTLDKVGSEFEMTRERVRQICKKFENRLDKIPQKNLVPLKISNKVHNLVLDRLPIFANKVESEIEKYGLTKKRFRLEGLITVNDLRNRKSNFTISTFQQRRFVILQDDIKIPNLILFTARKTIEHWGVATVADIATQVSNNINKDIDEIFISEILSCIKDFSWLDNDKSWFWLKEKPSRSRLRNLIKKVLSVSDLIEISELRAGVGRYYRMEGFSPPKRVLLELCKQLSWCIVQGNIVKTNTSTNWEEVLDRSSTEWGLAAILKEYGPVLSRIELQKKCKDIGMSKPAFFQALAYSPIINKYATGVYGLRGSKILPGTIESIIPKRNSEKVLKDYGWTKDYKIWIAYKISAGMLETGIFHIPSAMREFIQGHFDLITADSVHICNFKIDKNSGWSLSAFFKRRGGEVGDYMIFKFDIKKRQTKAYLGDIDLLDEFRNEEDVIF